LVPYNQPRPEHISMMRGVLMILAGVAVRATAAAVAAGYVLAAAVAGGLMILVGTAYLVHSAAQYLARASVNVVVCTLSRSNVAPATVSTALQASANIFSALFGSQRCSQIFSQNLSIL
jgi:hypothetical protein